MAVKLSNKKSADFYLLFLISLFVFFLSALFIGGLLKIEIGSKYEFGVYIFCGFIFITMLMYLRKIKVFDYDSTGEVISIKTYLPSIFGFKANTKLFEIPKEYVKETKLENRLLENYLVITFQNSSGKILRRHYTISGYSKTQLIQLKSDLNYYFKCK